MDVLVGGRAHRLQDLGFLPVLETLAVGGIAAVLAFTVGALLNGIV